MLLDAVGDVQGSAQALDGVGGKNRATRAPTVKSPARLRSITAGDPRKIVERRGVGGRSQRRAADRHHSTKSRRGDQRVVVGEDGQRKVGDAVAVDFGLYEAEVAPLRVLRLDDPHLAGTGEGRAADEVEVLVATLARYRIDRVQVDGVGDAFTPGRWR